MTSGFPVEFCGFGQGDGEEVRGRHPATDGGLPGSLASDWWSLA